MELLQQTRDRITNALIACGLALLAIILVLATQSFYGMGWDEGYYYPAYEDVAEWLLALTGEGEAITGDGIRAGWELIHELPPLTKWCGAILVLVTPDGLELETVRLFSALAFGLTVALIFLIGRKHTSIFWAPIPALFYLFHPRLFGHAHFAASETLFAFLTALAIFIADGDLRYWGRRIVLALVAGLALATKANGLVLIAALAVWLIIRYWFVPRNDLSPTLKDNLLSLALIVLGAPLVAFLIWPWLWDDTFARVAEYWQFVTQHPHYGVWYLGQKWVLPPGNLQPVPWHYPIVMTTVASPVVFIILMLVGIFSIARSTTRLRRFSSYDLLLLLTAAAPITANMLPSTPRYDVLRLFLPAFVPLSLMIGRVIPRDEDQHGENKSPKYNFIMSAIAAVLAVVPVVPYLGTGLSYYNLPTKIAAPRGNDFPFVTTYWGESITPEVMEEVAAMIGADEIKVRPLALHGAVLQIQGEWGRFPPVFSYPPDPPYDAHLLQNRKGFWGRTEWWFVANREPLAVWPEGSDNPRLYLFDGRPPGVE